jgi:hypothetical protein
LIVQATAGIPIFKHAKLSTPIRQAHGQWHTLMQTSWRVRQGGGAPTCISDAVSRFSELRASGIELDTDGLYFFLDKANRSHCPVLGGDQSRT